MSKITKDEFLKPSGASGPFDIDGLGEVYVRKVAFADAVFINDDSVSAIQKTAQAIIASVCDSDGVAVFGHDDLPAILASDLTRTEPLVELVAKHSDIWPESVEDGVGNSEAITPSDSGTS